ncbi:hypothetical protein F4820DRAFT_414938 [Hypoxylon rubiginosum]|uniref:Uncharacterized protein n=1 Tax=Hypoxylon rubiginosum TaxID=110542 RepID=A0ACB9Z5X4_9PEZI|nr:hypothetical protein F4820DRAFT_414938 [Hypoxylon rubiginosum]
MENNAWKYQDYLCSVCGLPLRSPHCGTEEFLEDRSHPGFDTEDAIAKLTKGELWLDDAMLLCDPDDEVAHMIPSFSYENLRDYAMQHLDTHTSLPPPLEPPAKSNIEEFKAEHMGGPCFYLYDLGGIKREVNVNHWDFPTFDGRSYIPIHSACLGMAKKVIRHSSHKYLGSIRSLFLALRWRHAVSNMFGTARAEANYMLAPTRWYLSRVSFWEYGAYDEDGTSDRAEWPGPTHDPEFNLLYTFLSDPIEIEDLTDTILSNLEPCRRDAVRDDATHLQNSLAALPEDIFQVVLSQLRSFRDLPRRATYSIPQHYWKNELILGGKGLLPWLWDIDPDKVNCKADEPCPGGEDFEWNWELLVRQLSRNVDGGIGLDIPGHDVADAISTVFTHNVGTCTYTGYHNDLRYVPRGLHNRRRIWQLLEEMFVGDQLPLEGKPDRDRKHVPPRQKCVQLPWTKEGDLRDSAIWLPTIKRNGAFIRLIGGQVYSTTSKSPLQYWQTPEFRRENGEEADEPVKPASATEVLEVIRKLGYPV